jgi:NAD(P) transhydrogenase subunit beta
MPQAFDCIAWLRSLPEACFGAVLDSALAVTIGFALVVALSALTHHNFNHSSTRHSHLAAMLGSATGFAFMSGGCTLYLLSSSAWANTERMAIYSAVFIGALFFAASGIAVCKLRGVLPLKTVALPGHGIANLIAFLLCGWLGYGFVTGQAQPSGCTALLASSALACAIGVHMTTSRKYRAGHALVTGRSALQSSLEWHGGDEPAWVLREITLGSVRAAAYRHRRDWHNGNSRSRVCIRHRLTRMAHCATRRR